MTFTNRPTDIRRYAIESGIPIAANKPVRVYPFASMNVGDSFPLEDNDWREVDRVRASVQSWQKRHAPMKFAVRQTDPTTKTYRVWRIA